MFAVPPGTITFLLTDVEGSARRWEHTPTVIARYCEILDEADEGVTTALWAPPRAADDEELPPVLGEILGEDAERLFEVFGLLGEKHPMQPHYYLFLLGTRPQWQGRGLGSSLIAPVLERCDRDRVPAYLEATSERNVPLYLRHGFEVTAEIQIPGGPKVWPMWRAVKQPLPGTAGGHSGSVVRS